MILHLDPWRIAHGGVEFIRASNLKNLNIAKFLSFARKIATDCFFSGIQICHKFDENFYTSDSQQTLFFLFTKNFSYRHSEISSRRDFPSRSVSIEASSEGPISVCHWKKARKHELGKPCFLCFLSREFVS